MKPKRRSKVVLEAVGFALLVVLALAVAPQGKVPDGLLGLFLLSVAGFLWKLVEVVKTPRFVRRLAVAGPAAQPAKPGDELVAWLLPVAVSSPSRAEAERSLPEYSARLLRQGQKQAIAIKPH